MGDVDVGNQVALLNIGSWAAVKWQGVIETVTCVSMYIFYCTPPVEAISADVTCSAAAIYLHLCVCVLYVMCSNINSSQPSSAGF